MLHPFITLLALYYFVTDLENVPNYSKGKLEGVFVYFRRNLEGVYVVQLLLGYTWYIFSLSLGTRSSMLTARGRGEWGCTGNWGPSSNWEAPKGLQARHSLGYGTCLCWYLQGCHDTGPTWSGQVLRGAWAGPQSPSGNVTDDLTGTLCDTF